MPRGLYFLMTLVISLMFFLWQLSQLTQLCFISAAPNAAVGEALLWPLELSEGARWCQVSSHSLGMGVNRLLGCGHF